MPSFENWFKGPALFLAGSFVFTIFVSLVGIRDMVSDRSFFTLIVLAAGLGLLAWYTAAKQEKENTALKTMLSQIADTIKPPAQEPDFIEKLKQAKPAQLRETIAEFARELRSFEHEKKLIYERWQNSLTHAMINAKTEEEKKTIWLRDAEASCEASRQTEFEFQNRFLSRAQAYHEELTRRLGLSSKAPLGRRIIALYGRLAGPAPISELARVWTHNLIQ